MQSFLNSFNQFKNLSTNQSTNQSIQTSINHETNHFVVTTDINKFFIIESFFIICALPFWIFAFWSFIWSSIYAILSYTGNNDSSLIFVSACIFVFDALYCLLQNCNSLFIAYTSSFMNSIDLPNGAVFWHIV